MTIFFCFPPVSSEPATVRIPGWINGEIKRLEILETTLRLSPCFPFNDAVPAVAKEEGVIFRPFFLEGGDGNSDLNPPDGIHPTAQGYKIIAEKIYPYVIEAIKRTKGSRR